MHSCFVNLALIKEEIYQPMQFFPQLHIEVIISRRQNTPKSPCGSPADTGNFMPEQVNEKYLLAVSVHPKPRSQ
jgi:hypothetical protein